MLVLRLIACALMVVAFVPHHHADAASSPAHHNPCSICVSMQNSAASLAAEAPSLAPRPTAIPKSTDSAEIPALAPRLRPSSPRAPPF